MPHVDTPRKPPDLETLARLNAILQTQSDCKQQLLDLDILANAFPLTYFLHISVKKICENMYRTFLQIIAMRQYVEYVFNICEYLRIFANICGYLRKYAKICGPHGNMRKCAPHVLRIFSVSQHAVSNGIGDSLTKSCAKCAAHILDII